MPDYPKWGECNLVAQACKLKISKITW